MTTTLTANETAAGTSQLVAVHKRLKELLSQQCDRFRNYLLLFDKQQIFIEAANADELLAYVDFEERVVAEIFSIQKVIDPLEKTYKTYEQADGRFLPRNDITVLKAALEELRQEAVYKLARNRELLSARMTDIRREIDALKNSSFTGGRRPVFHSYDAASLVDITC